MSFKDLQRNLSLATARSPFERASKILKNLPDPSPERIFAAHMGPFALAAPLGQSESTFVAFEGHIEAQKGV